MVLFRPCYQKNDGVEYFYIVKCPYYHFPLVILSTSSIRVQLRLAWIKLEIFQEVIQIIYMYSNLSACYSWGRSYVEKTYIFDIQSDYTSDSALRYLIRNSHRDRSYTTENRSRKSHLIVILINNLHVIYIQVLYYIHEPNGK